jgi:Ca2+-transporting ATPase
VTRAREPDPAATAPPPRRPADPTTDPAAPRGLGEAEAARRLAADGPNTLARDARRGLGALLLDVAREPMFLLLLACAAIYLALGDLQEAAILLVCVTAVLTITIVQARRTDRAVAALRDLSSPRALVLRDGRERRVAGAEVVRGDLVRLHEGDRVPADAELLAATHLAVDESLLTGESIPAHKDARERVFAGTLVVRGHGLAEVTATGRRSELGKIGVSLAGLASEPSRVQREVTRLVRVFGLAGAACCLAVLLILGLVGGSWLAALLAGVTVAMSLVPEEFPLVLTVFLALGAWRLSRRQVLVRRLDALESLGGATTLCVDKTGTLTHNRIALASLRARAGSWSVGQGAPPPDVRALAEHAALASRRETFDPIDDACRRTLEDPAFAARVDGTLEREYPLTPALPAVTHVWRSPAGRVAAMKGAPEAIAELCRLDAAARAELRREVEAMADTGLRVLAVARADLADDAALPDGPAGFAPTWLGLLGLQDPPRAEAAAALDECRGAGIRVVMITGDGPGTARAIGAAVGLSGERLLTGAELAATADADLPARLRGVEICARVTPDQKLRLVRALQAQGEVVAMTGDGVNDAPALKAAQVGVAMGGRGTDVAREAAALVLTRDDFRDLVAAVAEGRRIFDNLRKALGFIVAVHVPIAGVAVVPLLLGLPMLFHPVHVVFLELIIDPACSVVFEAEPAEPGLMRRPPRGRDDPLLDRRTLLLCLALGLSALAACLAALLFSLRLGQPLEVAQAVTFTTLILADLGLILVHRSWTTPLLRGLRTPNRALWWVVLGALAVLAATLAVPGLRALFHFAAAPAWQLLAFGLLGPLSVMWFELLKRRRCKPCTDAQKLRGSPARAARRRPRARVARGLLRGRACTSRPRSSATS